MKTPRWLEKRLAQFDEETIKHSLQTADWEGLVPEEKVRIIEAMGFTAFRDAHQPECPIVWDSGLICNCVRPTTVWGPPTDVQVLRKETWEDRLQEKRRWDEKRGRR